ncbi:hypothetical protein YB2330_002424 [Saitoella coloradoensis]
MAVDSAILAINAGSSSVKFSLFSRDGRNLLVSADVKGLTSSPTTLNYTAFSTEDGSSIEETEDQEVEVKDHEDAFKVFVEHLTSDDREDKKVLDSGDGVEVTCHRIVHGGASPEPLVINDETYKRLDDLSDLAPLHNHPALLIVKACMKVLPKSKNVAYFDSSFHTTIPEHIFTYPVDPSLAKEKKIRKYGFHGLSYSFITKTVAKHLGKKLDDVNIIALHLGSGASACCIKGGKSLDTSMGLTPLEGLPGGTRSGTIDPSASFHLLSNSSDMSSKAAKELHLSKAEQMLNKESGWKALCGTTDFGEITKKAFAAKPDEMCKIAFDLFVDRIIGYIGSYYVKLGGKVDALVFAGGIGEKGEELRAAVGKHVECLGFKIDESENGKAKGKETVKEISAEGGEGEGKKVLVVKTDEQGECARQLVENPPKFD